MTETERETEETEVEAEKQTEEYQPTLHVTGSGPVTVERLIGTQIHGGGTIEEEQVLQIDAEITPEEIVEALEGVRNPDRAVNKRRLLEYITEDETIEIPGSQTEEIDEWTLEVQGEVRDMEILLKTVKKAEIDNQWSKSKARVSVYSDLKARGIFGSGLYVAGMRRQLINQEEVDLTTAQALVDHLTEEEDDSE